MRRIAFFALLFALPQFSFAEPEPESRNEPLAAAYRPDNSKWYRFARANAFGIFQSSGGKAFAPEASWNPNYIISRNLAVRGNLGFGLLQSGDGTRFLTLDVEALLSLRNWNPWRLDAGGGTQTWVGNRGTHPIFTVSIARQFDPLLKVINQVFVGGSTYLYPSDVTYQVRLGIGWAF